jgi:hypothetical protein
MKHMKKIVLLAAGLWIGLIASAQPMGAGIYKLRWYVDKRLTNTFTINNSGTTPLTIPPALYDSVMHEVFRLVKAELQSDVRFVYPLNNRGEELRYATTTDLVGGLPRGTKKKAMKTEYMEYYVKFKINVGVNSVGAIGGEVASYSRLKPYVQIKMKAYGLDRRVKRRKTARTSKFSSIGSFQYNIGGVTMTNNNAIPIEQVVSMVFDGLEKFKSKNK